MSRVPRNRDSGRRLASRSIAVRLLRASLLLVGLLFSTSSPPIFASRPQLSNSPMATESDPVISPRRLIEWDVSPEEEAEARSCSPLSPRFRVNAKMDPFRMEAGGRISTTPAALELSFVPGAASRDGDLTINQPAQIDGVLRIVGRAGTAEIWEFHPGNFAAWHPHVTLNRSSGRVTIVAPTILKRAQSQDRVPVLLVLNCSLEDEQLDCYSAASIAEEVRQEFNTPRDKPVSALGLEWEPLIRTTSTP